MFRLIIDSSLKFRVLVVAFAATLAAFGTLQLQKMPVDVFPEFAPPIVEVQTEALGLSATEVEDLITLNLEELLSGVPWLKSIRSQSVTGLSSIILTFERGTDVYRARQLMQERLTLAYTLPNVAKPPQILQPVSATSRFMMIGLSSKTVDPMQLSVLSRWTVKPKLLGVPGVANVSIWGERMRQLHVQVDPERLKEFRVSQDDVIAATGDALWSTPLTYLKGSAAWTGGWIDGANQRLGVQHRMPISKPEDMAKIPVGALHLLMTGKTQSLGDVAEVTDAHPQMIGDAIVNKGNGIMLVIEKFPSANTLDVTAGVDKAIAELKLGMPGIEIDSSIFRLADYIGASIGNLTAALLIGGALMVVALGMFLFNWRSALVSAIAVPLSLLAAVLFVRFFGHTINTMIILGLIVALGAVIDDAVVDAENLMRRVRERREKDGGASLASVIVEAMMAMRRAAIYATLIVIAAITPVFFIGGLSGAFFQPLAVSFALALVASMAVALTVTPALSLMLMGKTPAGQAAPPAAQWLEGVYDRALARVLAAPRGAFVAAAAAVVVGAGLWPFLGQSLLPPLQERQLRVTWNTPAGTSHPEVYRITSRVSRELQSIPGVSNVGAHIGRAISGDQIVGANSGQIWVSIDPKADYDKTVAAMREVVAGYPGIESDVRPYLRDKVAEVLTGANKAIVVRILGARRDVMQQKAEDVRKAISGIPGISNLRVMDQDEEAEIRVHVDLDAAGKENVKPGDIRRSAATVFSGLNVGYLFEEQKIFDVVVWGAPEARRNLDDIKNVWVEKSNRTHARLGDVAKVSMSSTPTVLRHEGISGYVDVVADVTGADIGSVTREVERRVQTVNFPLEYHPEIRGEYTERQNVQKRVMGIALAALVWTYLLLQACFGSWRLAAVAFAGMLTSLAGGVLAVLAGGGTVTMGSLVGFLAVIGISARYGILLIDRLQDLERREGVAFGLGLIMRGARERLSPIVTSAATIIAALLPIVLFGSIPGLEIARPTVMVIMGGVAASALVTLFVLPALYLIAADKASRPSDVALA
jgi:CzcA family heavy metal efflux pump